MGVPASLALVLVLVSSVCAACTSWHNCPTTCPNGTSENDLLAFLTAFESNQPAALSYFSNVQRALDIIGGFGTVHSSDIAYLHTTVMYLCCYGVDDYVARVFPAIEGVAWKPFRVSFDKLVCNYDNSTNGPNATTTSLILLLSQESSWQLGNTTQQFEAAIRARGLPVVPRTSMERYHSTVAVVPAGFPVARAVAAVNAHIADWTGGHGPIVVNQFDSVVAPLHVFHASGSQ